MQNSLTPTAVDTYIPHMLSSRGYIVSSAITTHTLSRYSFRGSHSGCPCLAHDITVFEQHIIITCRM